MLSRPLLSTSKLVSRISITTRTNVLKKSLTPKSTKVININNNFLNRCYYYRSLSSYSSYGKSEVNGEPVDARNIVPGRQSQKYAREHEQDYDADNVGYNTENDKNIKQSSSAYSDPDKNNLSEEIMENESDVEYDNKGTDSRIPPDQQTERDLELNSIPYTEHDNSALDGKMMSSSSSSSSSSYKRASSSRIPSPSLSEAIVHAEREFADVDPLHIDVSENNNGKLDETIPLSNGQNKRDIHVRDDDNTTVGRMKRSRGKQIKNDENELHTNIPSS